LKNLKIKIVKIYMFDKIQIKPCFRRQGNKYPLKKKIIPEIPEHSKYIEPFCGTGAIFFNKQKASINVLNDLDEGIIKGLNLLKIASSDITKYKQNMNTVENIKHFYDNHEITNEDNLMFEIIKT
jgi:DNA adenine methylase